MVQDDQTPRTPDSPETSGEHAESKERQRIKGVFSAQTIQKVGTGTTTRKTIQKSFFMCDEDDEGFIEAQPLNLNYIPSGPKQKMAMDEFLQKFSPEPEFYVSNVLPKMRELDTKVVSGERHRSKGELFSAEHEFSSALQVDEENVRANFGLGLTYLERGEADKADNIFERLVKLDAAFEEEHKHLFNEFGISLRKNKMFQQSVEYYTRALDLSKADENLHYNIARAYFDNKEMDQAAQHLVQALRMNPGLEAARQFLDWLKNKNLIPADVGADLPAPGQTDAQNGSAEASPKKQPDGQAKADTENGTSAGNGETPPKE